MTPPVHSGEPETPPQTDPFLQAWREWTMTVPRWDGLQLVREAFVAGWEAAALAAPGAGLDVAIDALVGAMVRSGRWSETDARTDLLAVTDAALRLGATPDPRPETDPS